MIHIHELEDELAFSNTAQLYATPEGEVMAASPLALKLLGYHSYELSHLYLAQIMPQVLRLSDVRYYQQNEAYEQNREAKKPVIFLRKSGTRFAANVIYKQRAVSIAGETLMLNAMVISPLPAETKPIIVRAVVAETELDQQRLPWQQLAREQQNLQAELEQQINSNEVLQHLLTEQASWQLDLNSFIEQPLNVQSPQKMFNLPMMLMDHFDDALTIVFADECAEVVLGEIEPLLQCLKQLCALSQSVAGVLQLTLSPATVSGFYQFNLSLHSLPQLACLNELIDKMKACLKACSGLQRIEVEAHNNQADSVTASFEFALLDVTMGRSFEAKAGRCIVLSKSLRKKLLPQLQYFGFECELLSPAQIKKAAVDAAHDADTSSVLNQADMIILDQAEAVLEQQLLSLDCQVLMYPESGKLLEFINQFCSALKQSALWPYAQAALFRKQQHLCLPQQNAVLLVSEDAALQQALEPLVEQENCYLVATVNALDAVLAVQERAYQAIVLDCQLESMPAFETLAYMQNNAILNRHTQVFALTQKDTQNIQLAAQQLGVTRLYLKDQLNHLAADLQRYLFDAEHLIESMNMAGSHIQRPLSVPCLDDELIVTLLQLWGSNRIRQLGEYVLGQLQTALRLWYRVNLNSRDDQLTLRQALETYMLALSQCLGLSAFHKALQQSFSVNDNFAKQQLQQVLLQQCLDESLRALWFEFGLSISIPA